MRRRWLSLRALLMGATLSLLVAVPLALAAEVSREEYKAQVEPICKQNSEANSHILKGVHTEVKQGKLRLAGTKLIKAAAALRQTLKQLEVVPRPAADEGRLTEWLKRIGKEATLLEQSGKALKAGQKGKASNLQARLYTGARLTNAIVVAFGFHYCRFEPSKYT